MSTRSVTQPSSRHAGAAGLRARAGRLLALADVEIGGSRPWDMQVHDDAVYARVFSQGSLGLGESYMDGLWDCEQLDEFFFRIQRAELEKHLHPWAQIRAVGRAWLFNLQTPARAFEVGRRHYDIGDDLYERMLDRRMIYSCAWWKDARDLDAAQEAKLDLVCRKLHLEPGMRVLDIGCGWGGMVQYAAERYGVEAVGVTVSEHQAEHARKVCAGLPVDIRLQDYRQLDEPFDRVLSIGMFEHVGSKNYDTYMRVVRRCLKDDGLFLLHTIGRNRTAPGCDPWFAKYIFPNSMLPSPQHVTRAAEPHFVLEDWHNIGPNYTPTLLAWYGNIRRHWPELQDRYDNRFYRMWTYYLQCCAGAFRARIDHVWQIVFSPHGVPGGYTAVR